MSGKYGGSVPEHIINGSDQEKISFFYESAIIVHPKLMDVFEYLKRTISSREVQIILVVGPTRVGKTTLRDRILQNTLSLYDKSLKVDPSIMPILSVEAAVSRRQQYDWKGLTVSILDECLRSELNPKKFVLNDTTGISLEEVRRLLSRDASESSMMSAMQRHLVDRRVRHLAIDEAHNIFERCQANSQARLNMNILKSISNKTGSQLILFASPAVLKYSSMSAEVASRTKIIHFTHYSMDKPEDTESFGKAVGDLLSYMPLEVSGNIYDKLPEFYEGSCGCIGLLKNWMMSTLQYVLLSKKKQYLVWNDFKKMRQPADSLNTIAEEIYAQNSYIKEYKSCRVRDILSGKAPEKKSSNRKPGERLPSRDTVG